MLAAAVLCRAEVIVTDNLRDFPVEALDPFGLKAVTADAHLARTCDLHPDEALTAMRALRRRYRNPPYTPDEFLRDLAAKGLPELAARLQKHEGHLW